MADIVVSRHTGAIARKLLARHRAFSALESAASDVTRARRRRARAVVATTPAKFVSPRLAGAPGVAASWLDWLGQVFGPTSSRFRHSVAVWQRAVEVRQLSLPWLDPVRADALELAALLHDVGRALDSDDHEPHGFVGARLLDAMGLHDVAALVAHHSGARQEAAARGMEGLDIWSANDRDLQAVLTYLDRTTSPDGERMTLSERRADISHRYGSGSLQVRLFDSTLPEVRHARRLLRRPAGSRGDEPPG